MKANPEIDAALEMRFALSCELAAEFGSPELVVALSYASAFVEQGAWRSSSVVKWSGNDLDLDLDQFFAVTFWSYNLRHHIMTQCAWTDRSLRHCALRNLLACAVMLGSLGTGLLNGQSALVVQSVHGVAFDSLHSVPLAGATVRIMGRSSVSVSDARGRFKFDSVAPGAYQLVLEHAELDSIGLTELATRVVVDGQQRDVTIAIPSFATLWQRTCGTMRIPVDSGFMYGAIRDARNQDGIRDAHVSVSWTDVGLNAKKKLKQTRFTFDTRTDSLGRYVACGVPVDVPLHIAAWARAVASESLASNAQPAVVDSNVVALDLPARASRVQRRDLMLGAVVTAAASLTAVRDVDSSGGVDTSSDARPKTTGVVRGTVTNTDGTAVADVRVVLDGVEGTRTNAAGEFVQTAPAGTRTLELFAIGSKAVSRIVDIAAGDTARVRMQMERVTLLERVDVKATVVSDLLREFEERKRMGFGYIRDSTEMRGMFEARSAIRTFPSTQPSTDQVLLRGVELGKPWCNANIFVDRQRMVDARDLYAIPIDDIAWIEVYPHRSSVPREFMGGGKCGAVAVFTKRVIKR